MGEEMSVFLRFLDQQRHHVLEILEGLSDEDLRRPIMPSGWSSLGLVKHLALEVEHYWFRCIVGGESLDFFNLQAPRDLDAWRVEEEESADVVLDRYRSEIEQANAVLADADLAAPPAQHDEWWGEWNVPDVRFVLLHVIAETACHAGHLDAVREMIDGRQRLVL